MKYKVFLTSLLDEKNRKYFYIEWVQSFENNSKYKVINSTCMGLYSNNGILPNTILSKNRIHKTFNIKKLYYEI